VIPFLSLFRELAPRLAGLRLTDHVPVRRGDGFMNPGDETRIREISPAGLAKFKESPLILDVREQEEFFSGHIKGAKNITRSLLEQTISEIAPDRSSPILVYCAAGNRAALAADSLQKMGYRNVFSLKGGLSAWLEAGGLVETRRALAEGRGKWRNVIVDDRRR
jgi:phage shock protein E